ncbi:MAG: 50S ribosomal protein L11 methyltransferase [Acidobacteria bacterium]|nr:50S ribosomal protein L11 methyltransferase [Acidobacteriota bacterium]
MLELAHVRPGETVIDLGCGDGRIVIAAAKDFHAHGIGYDLDPLRISEARANAAAAGVSSQTEFIQQDLFQAPIWKADVVSVFLLPPVMDRLLPRLRSELSPGTRIVSHSFLFHAWPPDKAIHPEGRTLYLWTMPAGGK